MKSISLASHELDKYICAQAVLYNVVPLLQDVLICHTYKGTLDLVPSSISSHLGDSRWRRAIGQGRVGALINQLKNKFGLYTVTTFQDCCMCEPSRRLGITLWINSGIIWAKENELHEVLPVYHPLWTLTKWLTKGRRLSLSWGTL